MTHSPSSFEERRSNRLPESLRAEGDTLDGLTGLPSREWLYEVATKAIERYPGNVAVVFADLNDLKSHNDTYGHPDGDEYIKTAADVISETIRNDDAFGMVSHFGGDEFAIVLGGVSHQDQVDAAIGRVKDTLNNSYGISIAMGGRPHRVGETREEIFEAADALMYLDKKQQKRNSYTTYQLELIKALGRIAKISNIKPRDIELLSTDDTA